jgi:hypothetical protein
MTKNAADDREVTIQAKVLQALKKSYESSVVLDDPREEATAEFGRVVLREYPALWPHRHPEDDSVRLPLRLVGDDGMVLGLEIGPLDFKGANLEVLRRAIADYDHAMTVTRSVEREYAAEISGEDET